MTRNTPLTEVISVLKTKNKGTLVTARWYLEKGGINQIIEEAKTEPSAVTYKLKVAVEDKERAKELLGDIQFLLDFEKGVGTYVKVIRQSSPTNPDSYLVLYLRPGDRFLFLGYWPGYEYTAAAGRWERRGDRVQLIGKGEMKIDVVGGDFSGKHFERLFVAQELVYTPALYAAEALEDWSLIGWRGTYVYIGQSTVYDPDGLWLPKSLDVIDEWISRLLGSEQR